MNMVASFILFMSLGAIPLYCQSFSDEFNGTMNPEWQWVREDAARWLVSQNELTIITQTGALHGTVYNNVQNILLQQAPPNACAIDTKFSIAPDSSYHHAGIVYYLDDDNFIRLARGMYDGEQCVWFGWDLAGAYEQHQINDVVETTIYLRLIANSNRYFTGYYSIDGIHWNQVYTAEIPFPTGSARIGLIAANGDGIGVTRKQIPVRFDYFRVDPTVHVDRLQSAQTGDISLDVYPQPSRTGETVTVSAFAGVRAPFAIEVFDIHGRCVYRRHGETGNGGTVTDAAALRGIPGGVYQIVFRSGARAAYRRAVVMR